MAKMNQGLSLNQMQLFAYAIFSTQQDGKTEFRKYEFENKFSISQFRPDDAMDDAYRLLDLKIQIRNSDQEKGRGHNVFTDYYYDRGQFTFKWNESFLPHILELREKYVISDLAITSKFKSGFSWILYDYIKAHYGNWYKELSKKELMSLFNVENRKSYQRSTAEFKRSVIDVAIKEINEYTELEVRYEEKKVGNKIIGFVLHWSTGKKVSVATEKQLTLLREIQDEVEKNMFDYLSLKDVQGLDQARRYIIAIKEINNKVSKGLSSSEASEVIQEAKQHYLQLENLLEQDGKKRDTSVYFNWLENES